MRVLVACEESQAVCIAFRERGHEAFSCDIQECSGGHPEWHYQRDIFEVIDMGWDLMIAHPPCTYMSNAGARWLYQKGKINIERYENGVKGKEFFMKLFNANIPRIAIENPTPSRVFNLPKPSQVIQPYMFGDSFSKRTLLWLKNLPKLYHNESVNLFDNVVTHTDNWIPYLPSNTGGKKRCEKYFYSTRSAKEASKTFEGIAKAMADQWG